MKPGFALSLSFEGISLLHRAAGGWRRVGEVALDVPDLAASLSELREKALLIEPAGISCKLIIPNDQIRYLTLETGRAEGEARRALVREALDGATPYAVEDLAYDISVEGHTTHVAAVARETLDEAEAFAVEHRFNPVSFVAVPGDQPFLGEPYFGTAGNAGKTEIEPDGVAVVVTGPAVIPEPEAAPLAARDGAFSGEGSAETPAADPPAPAAASTEEPSTPAADQPAPPEETADPAPIAGPAPPAVGFSSRRGKEGEGPAPALAGASRDDPQAAQKAAPALSRPDRADPAPVQGTGIAAAPGPAPVPPPAPTRSLGATAGPGASAPPPSVAAATALLGSLRSRATGLLRRSPAKAKAEPLPVGKPAAKQSFTAATPAPEPTPDEAERLTVFGARAAQQSRGKPRHLGLILTIVLLLFLAAVAAWAALFTPEPLARLFAPAGPPARTADPQPETEPAPAGSDTAQDAAGPDSPGVENGPAPAQPPMISAVSPPAPSDLAAVLPPETATTGTEDAPAHPQAPQSPALTETDSAVLEALRADSTTPDAPDTDAPDTAAEDTARDLAALDPELEPEPEPEVRTGLAAPSLADTETFYATTGIWPTAPETPETPAIIGIDDLYVASIDRTDLSQDAVALPQAQDYVTDAALSGLASPAAAGTAFDLDTRGLVTPTPEGAVTPDGITVYLGRPPVVPPPTPARLTPADDAAVEAAALRERLAAFRPRPRPTDLIEQTERAQLGGRSRAELGGLRPRARASSAQDDATAPGGGEATPQAVASARIPRARPSDFQSVVRNSDRASIGVSGNLAAASPVAATVAPKIPSSASVARQATLKNEINLRQINLIGVYGTTSDRRALVRLSSGRYKKVKVGDSIDGGRVVAIGENQLRYQKGGRDHTLKMPSG